MIWFWIILIILAAIVICQKVKFNIDVSLSGFDYYFCIHVSFFKYLFTIYKEDIMKYLQRKKNNNSNQVKNKQIKQMLKYFDVERIIFQINIGAYDPLITSMAVPLVSTIFAIFLQKYFPQSIKKFRVEPIYNKWYLAIKGTMYISIPLKDLCYLLICYKNNENKILKKTHINKR